MERDVEILGAGVELGVEGGRVRREDEPRGRRLLDAGRVVRGAAGVCDELVAQRKSLVLELARVADGETRRIPVPLVVGLAHVAKVVQLFGGIVQVNISCHAVGCSGKVVGAVFNSPQPDGASAQVS